MSAEQQGDIISELELHVGECARNQHGNHVIQKLIEHADPNRLSFIKEFRGQVRELCSHPYGCRVLQRCLEHLDEEQTRPLMDELHQYSLELMQDQFGNYVIQYVLEQGEPADRDRIIRNLRGHLLDMSCHKYSSNVCEKALLQAAPADLQVLVDEILVTRVDGGTFVPRMIKDQYANYVLQRAMRVVDGDVQARLWRELRKVMPHMRKFSAAPAKHITNGQLRGCLWPVFFSDLLFTVQRILDQHPDV
jgi:pumilio RNA-binding family